MSTSSTAFEPPSWLWPLVQQQAPASEGEEWTAAGQTLVLKDGIPRQQALVSSAQQQTERSFGFKWAKRDTFESPESLKRMRDWLVDRYGDVAKADWLSNHNSPPLVVDAGCGAAMSGLEYFEPVWEKIRYLGCDISEAVDVARKRICERGLQAGFIQADICQLPLPEKSVDVIFSEGVLHHTDSTKGAIESLLPLLKTGGRFLFYVYRRKGPVREYTDELIREKLQAMTPQEVWKAVEPLTQLGIALGELNARIEIPKPIEILEIPAGEVDVQRLFYWHVAKAFYHPDLTFDEMNHINYDWYAPKNAHRQTIEEVRDWCSEFGLSIERERVEEAGITICAAKR